MRDWRLGELRAARCNVPSTFGIDTSTKPGMTQLNFSCDFYRMPAPSALETRIGCTRHGLEEGADFSSADHFGYMSWVDLPARLPDSVNRKFEPETCHGPYNRSF